MHRALQITAFLCLLVFAGPAVAEDYGVVTKFIRGNKLEFPDLTLLYFKKRSAEVAPGVVVTHHTFKASNKTENREFSWQEMLPKGSVPVPPKLYFQLNGVDYIVELQGSDILRTKLKTNELVLWKKEDYEKQLFKPLVPPGPDGRAPGN